MRRTRIVARQALTGLPSVPILGGMKSLTRLEAYQVAIELGLVVAYMVDGEEIERVGPDAPADLRVHISCQTTLRNDGTLRSLRQHVGEAMSPDGAAFLNLLS
jgi:hypothetical protein